VRHVRVWAFLCVLGMLFLGCEPLLIYEENIPDWKAPADKALLVVCRPSKLYSGKPGLLYHKGKYLGALQGGDVTSFEMEPGEHLIVAKADSKGLIKFNYRAGKVYYVVMAIYPIPNPLTTIIAVSLSPQPGDEAAAFYEEKKGKLKFARPNPNREMEDMEEDDWNDEVKDYGKWAADHPEDAAKESNYPGY